MFKKDELPILGILRGISEKDIVPIVNICKRTGIKYLEITMNTTGAVQLISKMISIAGTDLVIGAGTVLDTNDLRQALAAGARFIVSPSLVEEVVEACKREKILVFPGALTPTEVHKAWEMGASMVKLFPAGLYGPDYIQMLKAPFNSIKIMAVGGVNEKNAAEYFSKRADAVAFGAGIFRPEWLLQDRFELIEEHLNTFILACKHHDKNVG
jgi:2-dehydro-3-deoxyphosphogluconate aldolase / (4S)-4-hydroxy-2-oxoglutarate aldolase